MYKALEKGMDNGFAISDASLSGTYDAATTVADLVHDVNEIKDSRQTSYDGAHRDMSIDLFGAYNEGADTVRNNDTEKSLGMHAWDEQGISFVYGNLGIENDEVKNAIYDDNNNLKGEVLRSLGINLCGNDVGSTSSYDLRDEYLEVRCDYTREQIEDAFEVIIQGGQNVSSDNYFYSQAVLPDGKVGCPMAKIPTDLMNACVAAIDDTTRTGYDVVDCWDTAYKEYAAEH